MPVNFERYIELISKTDLDSTVKGSWLKSVKKNAPFGTVRVIQTLNDKNLPQAVSLVHRETKSGDHIYIVPLLRDLSDSEVQKIVDNFTENNPDLDFDISTSKTIMKQTEKEGLSLEQENHLALCMALAKQKHETWVTERSNAGWRYGIAYDEKERTHPLLRPWEQLPDKFREPDLEWPTKLIALLNTQGYAVIRSEELSKLLTLARKVK